MSSLQERITLAQRAGTIKRLHVDKRVIGSNRKHGTNHPPITVQTSAGPIKAMRISVKGPSEFIYDSAIPLSCGARLWIETTAALEGDWTRAH